MELTVNDLETVFGRRLDTLSDRFKEDTRNLYLIYENLGDIRKTLEGSFKNIMGDMRRSLENLAEKINVKQANGEKTSDIKINDILDNVSDTIAAVQKDNTEKITSNFSYNFRSLNDQLKLVNDLSIESNREQLIALQNTVDEKIEKLTSVIQGSFTPQKQAEIKKEKETNTASELLLTQQLMVLEKLKDSVDKKLNGVLDVITTTDKRIAADIKKEKLSPKEVALSKKDRKMLQAIDASDEVNALTKEVKESRKLDSKSGIGKFLSPFLLLLGGIGALAFGVFKFPTIKRVFEGFTKTGFGSSMTSFFQSVTPKGLSMKEFVRSLPFIGRFIDLWDALDLMNKGNYKQGFKQLGFVIPGMEYLAVLLGTSKQRLLAPQYDKIGDKSFRLPFLGVSVEQVFSGAYGGVTTVFKPIIEFFRDAFGALGEGFNLLMKGSSIDYNDIATTWDKITTDYFPVLRPVADVFKWLASSTFEWTAEKMKQPGFDTRVDKTKPINIGDVINTIFSTVGKTIQKTFNFVSTVMGAFGKVFSGDESKQIEGLNELERSGMGGIADSIGVFLNVIKSIKEMGGEDGEIGLLDIVTKTIKITEGPFSKKGRLQYAAKQKGPEAERAFEEILRTLEGKSPGLLTYGQQGLAEQTRLAQAGIKGKTKEQLVEEYKPWSWLFGDPEKNAEYDMKVAQEKMNWAKERLTWLERSKAGSYIDSIPGLREWIESQTEGVKADKRVEEVKISPEDARASQLEHLYEEESGRVQTAYSRLFNDMQPQQEQFDALGNYGGMMRETTNEVKRQTEATLELKSYLDQTIRPLLVEVAMTGKKQTTQLETTAKGIQAMGNSPRNNVVVSNSQRMVVNREGSDSALAFKRGALLSR